MHLQSVRAIRAALMATAAVAGFGSTGALAVDCDVNVFAAYQTAIQRSWKFACESLNLKGVTSNFVTYPPQNIGCVVKTPPVLLDNYLGTALLFRHSSGAKPELKNGWSVKGFEVQGLQWQPIQTGMGTDIRIGFRMLGDKPNWTYNARVNKLTLRKDGGNCAKAIDEAF